MNKTVELGEMATFSVRASGDGPLAYQWRKNGTDIPGATQSICTTPPATAEDNGGLFLVVVSNGGGGVSSTQAKLSVNLPPTITIQPLDKTVKVGKSVNFNVAATGAAPLSYQWYKKMEWSSTEPPALATAHRQQRRPITGYSSPSWSQMPTAARRAPVPN